MNLVKIERVEGETITRFVPQEYLTLVTGVERGVDFSVIPWLMIVLKPYKEFDLPIQYLRNANNSDLPKDVREMHFDIAGRLVYEIGDQHDHLVPAMKVFMRRWTASGGL